MSIGLAIAHWVVFTTKLSGGNKEPNPSGFFFKKLFKKLKNAIKSLIKTIVAAVILVVAAYIYLQTGLIPPEVFGLIVTGAIGCPVKPTKSPCFRVTNFLNYRFQAVFKNFRLWAFLRF